MRIRKLKLFPGYAITDKGVVYRYIPIDTDDQNYVTLLNEQHPQGIRCFPSDLLKSVCFKPLKIKPTKKQRIGKLTKDQMKYIRYNPIGYNQTTLAKMFSVSRQRIHQIISTQ